MHILKLFGDRVDSGMLILYGKVWYGKWFIVLHPYKNPLIVQQ